MYTDAMITAKVQSYKTPHVQKLKDPYQMNNFTRLGMNTKLKQFLKKS